MKGFTVSEDAIVDIPLEGTTDYMVCIQKDSVAEGLIRKQDEDKGLEHNQEDEGMKCNQKYGGSSENDSALNVNFEDFDEDAIGIGEETAMDEEDGKGKGKAK